MEKIIKYCISEKLLRQCDVEEARRQLGDEANDYFIDVVYGALPWKDHQYMVRLIAKDALDADDYKLAPVVLTLCGFLTPDGIPPFVLQRLRSFQGFA